MRLRSAFLALACVSWAFAQACGGDSGVDLDGSTDGTVFEAAPPIDSGNDVVIIDDTGTGDTGTPDTGTSDGSTADASDGGTQIDSGIGTWKCGATTVSDCAQCIGYTQPCVYCSNADASVLSGVCTLINTNCFNSLPNGYQDCACTDASTCPESYQVCSGQGRCHTCSDSQNNATLKCENGGTCSYPDGGCL